MYLSDPEHPFYLASVTHRKCPAENEKWYLCGPLGVNSLKTILPRMAQQAELPSLGNGKRLTNTSARKRLCQKMTESEVPDNQVQSCVLLFINMSNRRNITCFFSVKNMFTPQLNNLWVKNAEALLSTIIIIICFNFSGHFDHRPQDSRQSKQLQSIVQQTTNEYKSCVGNCRAPTITNSGL